MGVVQKQVPEDKEDSRPLRPVSGYQGANAYTYMNKLQMFQVLKDKEGC